MKRDAKPGTGRDHDPVAGRPRVGVERYPSGILANDRARGVQIAPEGGVRLGVNPEFLARFGEAPVDSARRAVDDHQVGTVAGQEAVDDRLSQLGAVSTTIAGDEDSHDGG